MSEQPKAPRSSNDVKSEYANLCLRAGNLQYEIATKEKDLELINASLRDLNFEFMAASKYEADVAAAVKAATPAPESAPTPAALSIVKES